MIYDYAVPHLREHRSLFQFDYVAFDEFLLNQERMRESQLDRERQNTPNVSLHAFFPPATAGQPDIKVIY